MCLDLTIKRLAGALWRVTLKIKAVIVFPNVTRIFHTKSQSPSEKIGWATTVWVLIEDDGLYWEVDKMGPNPEMLHTLSTEKKKRFASKLARESNYKIIYLDKNRANDSVSNKNGTFKNIPFRVGDI